MIIILIKIILVIISILSIGIIPLFALLNLWIWNNVIIEITGFNPITSFWVILGLTVACGSLFGGIVSGIIKGWWGE